ncbi:MAG: NusG domain II-containing protein [Lachnospiraceae bacterium]
MKKVNRHLISFLLFIFICMIFVVYLFFFKSDDGAFCEVSVQGEIVDRLPLFEDSIKRIDTPGGYNIITVKEGGVSVTEADCGNQICVQTGQIHKNGQIITCLPHGLIIKIVSGQDKEVDTIAY